MLYFRFAITPFGLIQGYHKSSEKRALINMDDSPACNSENPTLSEKERALLTEGAYLAMAIKICFDLGRFLGRRLARWMLK